MYQTVSDTYIYIYLAGMEVRSFYSIGIFPALGWLVVDEAVGWHYWKKHFLVLWLVTEFFILSGDYFLTLKAYMYIYNAHLCWKSWAEA